jgi:acetyl esterase
VLIYPGLGGDATKGSYVRHAQAPMLTTRDVLYYYDIRGGTTGDPTCQPLADSDFSGLPPTVIVTAECDPISSDGEIYRDRIVAAGGKASWREEPGLVHSYLRGRRTVKRAADSFARIADAVAALGKGEWPY